MKGRDAQLLYEYWFKDTGRQEIVERLESNYREQLILESILLNEDMEGIIKKVKSGLKSIPGAKRFSELIDKADTVIKNITSKFSEDKIMEAAQQFHAKATTAVSKFPARGVGGKLGKKLLQTILNKMGEMLTNQTAQSGLEEAITIDEIRQVYLKYRDVITERTIKSVDLLLIEADEVGGGRNLLQYQNIINTLYQSLSRGRRIIVGIISGLIIAIIVAAALGLIGTGLGAMGIGAAGVGGAARGAGKEAAAAAGEEAAEMADTGFMSWLRSNSVTSSILSFFTDGAEAGAEDVVSAASGGAWDIGGAVGGSPMENLVKVTMGKADELGLHSVDAIKDHLDKAGFVETQVEEFMDTLYKKPTESFVNEITGKTFNDAGALRQSALEYMQEAGFTGNDAETGADAIMRSIKRQGLEVIKGPGGFTGPAVALN